MNEHELDIARISRRDALRAGVGLAGGVAASGLIATPATANAAADDSKSAAAIPVATQFPDELWAQTPWVVDAEHPFDLEDPIGRWHALMKSTQNLVGARTYVSSYSRVYLTEVGKECQVFYGTCGTWTFQNVVPRPDQFPQFGVLPKGTALQLGLYTGVVLDPYTFKPVDEIYNPVVDRTVRAEDSLFAESYLLYPGGGMTSIERSEFMDSRESKMHSFVRSGNSLSWIIPALFEGTGDFQPRMDSSWWSCKYDELMDPSLDLIDCAYSWVGLTRVAEKGWWQMEKIGGRTLQTLWNTYGTVTNTLENVEPIVQEYVFSKYPDRI